MIYKIIRRDTSCYPIGTYILPLSIVDGWVMAAITSSYLTKDLHYTKAGLSFPCGRNVDINNCIEQLESQILFIRCEKTKIFIRKLEKKNNAKRDNNSK